MNAFKERFKKRFNADVQIYSPYVYDALTVMADAMVRANSTRPSAYLPELAKSNYKGVTGTISFDNKGDIRNGALTLFTYRGGSLAELGIVR
jgi:branched-chain amino acid transport system substrate-binding protein